MQHAARPCISRQILRRQGKRCIRGQFCLRAMRHTPQGNHSIQFPKRVRLAGFPMHPRPIPRLEQQFNIRRRRLFPDQPQQSPDTPRCPKNQYPFCLS